MKKILALILACLMANALVAQTTILPKTVVLPKTTVLAIAVAPSPALIHATGGCNTSASTTYALTIPSTASGDILAVGTYTEFVASKPLSTGLSWSGGTVTVTSSLNPGTGVTVAITSAAPSGYNGVYVTTSSSGTQFQYALASNPGTETSFGAAAVSPTIAASGVTFVAQESDLLYDSTRRSMTMWSAVSIPSSVVTVTATWPGSATGCIIAVEYSNQTTIDASAVSAGLTTNEVNSNSPFTGNTTTPTASKNEVLWGLVFDQSGPNNTATFAGTGGWSVAATAYENTGDFGSFAFYSQIVASTTGSYAITGTNSGASVAQSVTAPATFHN
jgi:hypothetical protein